MGLEWVWDCRDPRPTGERVRTGSGVPAGFRRTPRAAREPPATVTARATRAPRTRAAPSPGSSRWSCAPMVAAATGTPSWALASRAYDAGWRRSDGRPGGRGRRRRRGRPRARSSTGGRRGSPSCSVAPSQTKNNGPKKPSVTANSCLATRRGSPTAATASPETKPASISETCTATASAAIANTSARLTRSSTANCAVLRDVVHAPSEAAALDPAQERQQHDPRHERRRPRRAPRARRGRCR